MRRGIASALLLVLLALPASAFAVPPANDDFADRQVVAGPLPLDVSSSNDEATEEGEYGEGISVFAAGHSVWFEWEAPATRWTTIGVCGSDFPALLGVFAGTDLESLTKVASGYLAEGPHCAYSEREFTFKAKAGTGYVIGVDGNAYPGFEPSSVETEGQIHLRIEATPPPPNDDFAAAADLTASGKVYESEEPFYFARLESYNWGAGKETGEPDHQGNPGGASAWYEWTAPATGTAGMSMCCFGAPLLGIYTGNSVDALTAVPTESEFPPEVKAEVSEGQTYRIAVDGAYDEGTGEAAQVSYSVNVSMHLPPDPPAPPLVVDRLEEDLAPPETAVSRSVLKRTPPVYSFRFASSEAGSTFRCSLDRRPFGFCGSKRVFRRSSPGRHNLRVVAVDPAGNVDPTPATGGFRFPARHRAGDAGR